MIEFVKYATSVAIAFTVDLSILLCLTELFNVTYVCSAAIALFCGFSINYFLNISWVFKTRTYFNKPVLEYNLMVLISLFTSFLNFCLILIFTEIFFLFYINSKILSSIITFFLKFILKKYFLFNRLS